MHQLLKVVVGCQFPFPFAGFCFLFPVAGIFSPEGADFFLAFSVILI
jgi:hypothetical protein